MILDDIVKAKRKRLAIQKKAISLQEMKQYALDTKRIPVSFFRGLKQEGLSIIGEFKKASPSAGVIESSLNMTEKIKSYNECVQAISCLTEEDFFKGSTDYLREIRTMTHLPILRKDFMIDEYQIYEAKWIGADAVLLIAAILSDEELGYLMDLAHELHLDVLLEVHDEEEMTRALGLNADMIGVNNRDLKTFKINLETTLALSSRVGRERVFVSESGFRTDEDVETISQCHVDALLVGQSLMEAEQLQELVFRWRSIFDRKDRG